MSFLLCLLLIAPLQAGESPENLIIVAGQSNAVGFDARPGQLPTSELDQKVWFWWRCGDPPPDDHDSMSGKWVRLQPQTLGQPRQPRAGRQYGNFANPEGGFGPEIGLARRLTTADTGRTTVLKVAFSGTGIGRDWDPQQASAETSCYRALMEEYRKSTAAATASGRRLRPRAFVWVQGESDASATDAPLYAARLRTMIAALRRDLRSPELIVLLGVNTKFGNGRNRFMPAIVEAQRAVAATDPRCVYVDTSSAPIANSAHYSTEGTLLVGRLFADALTKLEHDLAAAGNDRPSR